MKYYSLLMLIGLIGLPACHMTQKGDVTVLEKNARYTVFKDRVIQGDNAATVLSPTHLRSNYKSPASATFSRLVKFKFSINEKDNELPPGQDHWVLIGDEHQSPVVVFGAPPPPMPPPPTTYLPVNYDYTFRVDVSPVLKQMAEKGYYETYDGSRVAQADFKGIYVAGGSDPLSWDFVNLANKGLKLNPTADQNIYTLTLRFNPYDAHTPRDREWKPTKDLSHKPQYHSEQPLVDALYNLSLEEALLNIEADGTLRTGAKWGGVWTRDVSYSTLLAFAYHEPEAAKTSLRRKVKRGRIIQDTGSGGAWPVSSDRSTWVLAAWEIYLVTGDRTWLDEIFPIVKNTLEDDYKTLYDPATGMFCGESSFLDWREQTYPKWMDNRDIYVSENLGTNVVHYRAHRILAEMARLKNEATEVWNQRAESIKKGVNTYLWQADKGYYAQYLYGRDALILSPRFEALGEALAVLFDVADADQAASVFARSPVTDFGVTCIYPQIPGIPPYHNNGIWPFVQSYWNWAAARTGNEAALTQGLGAIYRAAALFLTNYENMVAETGDFLGTEINSDRMLWSMAGNLAMVHRVFMGMEFRTEGLYFSPVVPKAYGGSKTLSNFKYRNTVLDITVNGHGRRIQSATIDGKTVQTPVISAGQTGRHSIVITLADDARPQQSIHRVANHFSPPTVLLEKKGKLLSWLPAEGAATYRVYKNGRLLTTTPTTRLTADDDLFASYQVSGVDAQGYEGFASEPVVFAKQVQIIELENFAPPAMLPYTNYSGKGFVEISLEKNRSLTLTLHAEKAGTYLLDVRYANGAGPWNTDNKCAIRSLTVNDRYAGVLVFPQRGKDEWSDWGYSNQRKVHLQAGLNTIRIHFEDWNHNMNVDTNTAMLDAIRIIQVD